MPHMNMVLTDAGLHHLTPSVNPQDIIGFDREFIILSPEAGFKPCLDWGVRPWFQFPIVSPLFEFDLWMALVAHISELK